ncbi:MAG: glycosyltransferase [Parabacteroides sp.]|nr:glycosyltransferase [Parabacteroides sp.]
MSKKLCLFFNTPSIYREEIYTKIEEKYDCDWYFSSEDFKVKTFDVSKYNYVHYLANKDLGQFFWIKGMVKLLKGNYEKYILVGDTRCLSLYVFLVLKKLLFRRKKVLLWTHGYYGKESWVQKNIFKRPLLKMADGLLLYGNYARELMLKDGFNPKTTLIIHNSLAYSEQLRIRSTIKASVIYKEHFGNDNPVLIFLGRLTPVKQLDMIVTAVAHLNDKGEQYNLVFVGDGSERERLEELVKGCGIESQVWFYGACYDEATNAELVYNADLCVAPGNIGLTAMHVMMFGCPALTHDCFKWQMPEFESIHPYKTGNFFKYQNQASLEEKISEWFRINGNLREEVRQACYKEIDEQWNPEFQMEVIEKGLNI